VGGGPGGLLAANTICHVGLTIACTNSLINVLNRLLNSRCCRLYACGLLICIGTMAVGDWLRDSPLSFFRNKIK